jgi:hypothetical protein
MFKNIKQSDVSRFAFAAAIDPHIDGGGIDQLEGGGGERYAAAGLFKFVEDAGEEGVLGDAACLEIGDITDGKFEPVVVSDERGRLIAASAAAFGFLICPGICDNLL